MAEHFLVEGQLVFLRPNAEEDKHKGDVTCEAEWMVVADTSVDNLIVFHRKSGGMFLLHLPYEGGLIFVPKKDEKPIMLKKKWFGLSKYYKFPEGSVG